MGRHMFKKKILHSLTVLSILSFIGSPVALAESVRHTSNEQFVKMMQRHINRTSAELYRQFADVVETPNLKSNNVPDTNKNVQTGTIFLAKQKVNREWLEQMAHNIEVMQLTIDCHAVHSKNGIVCYTPYSRDYDHEAQRMPRKAGYHALSVKFEEQEQGVEAKMVLRSYSAEGVEIHSYCAARRDEGPNNPVTHIPATAKIKLPNILQYRCNDSL